MKTKMFKKVVSFAAAAAMSIGIVMPVGAEDLFYYKSGEEIPVTMNGGRSVFSGDTTNSSVSSDGTINVTSALTSDTRFLFKVPSWDGSNMYTMMPYTTDNYKDSLLEMDVTLANANSADVTVNLGMTIAEYYSSINYNKDSRLLSQKGAKLSDYVEATTEKQTVKIPFEAFGDGIYGLVWSDSTPYWPLYKWEDSLADATPAVTIYDTLEPAKAPRKTIEAISGIEFLLPKDSSYGLKIENIRVVPRVKTLVTGDDLYYYTTDEPKMINAANTGIQTDNVGGDTTNLTASKTNGEWYFGVKEGASLTADTTYVIRTKKNSWESYTEYGNLPITPNSFDTTTIKFEIKLDDSENTNIGLRLGAAREEYSGAPNYKDSRAKTDKLSLSSYLNKTGEWQVVEVPVSAFGAGLIYQAWNSGGWWDYPTAKWTDLASGTSDTQTRNHQIRCANSATSTVMESIHGIEFVLANGAASGVTVRNLEINAKSKRNINGENTKIGYATGEKSVIAGYGIFDASGNEVTALTGGSKITVGGCMINESESAKKATIMLALYKGGVFERVYAFDANVNAGETGSFGGEYITLPDDMTNYTVKGLLWSDFDSMRPILDSIEVK